MLYSYVLIVYILFFSSVASKVKAQKDFSKEVYSSKWEYAKKYTSRQTVVGTTNGFSNYDFHDDQIRETVLLTSQILC